MSEITEVTRRAIVDYITVGVRNWAGRLEEADFLARIYDLRKIPSNDGRFKDAHGDIWQHRTNNNDWPNEWVFTDERFNLLWGPDDDFLRFLCETVHPAVIGDIDTAHEMVIEYNKHLKEDSWELFKKAEISGRPVFGARKIGTRVSVIEEPTGWKKVDRQIQEMKFRLDTASNEEQFQTVGLLSREVLISLAEVTYDKTKYPPIDGKEPSKTDAGRMLESLLEIELRGGTNEEARAYAKATLKLALALQHKRTADYIMAALCAEATISVVNIVSILIKEIRL